MDAGCLGLMHGWSLDFWSNGVGQECRNGSCVSVCMYAMVIVMVNRESGWMVMSFMSFPSLVIFSERVSVPTSKASRHR